MAADPLADVIAAVWEEAWRTSTFDSTIHVRTAAAVRAHIAAALDAEEADWMEMTPLNTGHGFARIAVVNLRATLLGTDEADSG